MAAKDDIGINPKAVALFTQLNTNIENLVKACMELSQSNASLEQKLSDMEVTADDGLIPLLERVDDKLDKLDGFLDSMVEASHSPSLGPKAWAVVVLTKMKEIFDLVEEKS